ncbi:MAG TPA: zf-HC2 domain-containing protein [Phycisphaerae bacterium]|nr:zf-HC2 domain-containing protein [Phycisphaerae bacterium]
MKNVQICRRMEQASAYYDGELSGDRRADFELHLADCGACRAELASLKGLSGRFAAMRTPAAGAALAEKIRRRLEAQEERGVLHAAEALMGIAAALMIAALVGLRMIGNGGTQTAAAPAPDPDWAVAAQHPVPDVAGGGQETVLAQWMVDDLSVGDGQ